MFNDVVKGFLTNRRAEYFKILDNYFDRLLLNLESKLKDESFFKFSFNISNNKYSFIHPFTLIIYPQKMDIIFNKRIDIYTDEIVDYLVSNGFSSDDKCTCTFSLEECNRTFKFYNFLSSATELLSSHFLKAANDFKNSLEFSLKSNFDTPSHFYETSLALNFAGIKVKISFTIDSIDISIPIPVEISDYTFIDQAFEYIGFETEYFGNKEIFTTFCVQ